MHQDVDFRLTSFRGILLRFTQDQHSSLPDFVPLTNFTLCRDWEAIFFKRSFRFTWGAKNAGVQAGNSLSSASHLFSASTYSVTAVFLTAFRHRLS